MRTTSGLRAAAAAALVLLHACAARPQKNAGPGLPPDPLDQVVTAILDRAGDIPDGTLAVHDITGVGGEISPEGRLVAERLTSRLAASGRVRVVERRRLEAALKELGLSASGAADQRGLTRAGFLSGAGAVVTGTLAPLDGGYELNARAINVATGDVVAASTVLLKIDLRPGGGNVRRLPPPLPSSADAGDKSSPPPGWRVWPGRGRFSFSESALTYCLEEKQHDHIDHPDGRVFPSTLLSRDIAGTKWALEVVADYHMNPASGHWISAFIWLGDEGEHPHCRADKGALCVMGSRFVDLGYKADAFGVKYEPGGKSVSFGPEYNSLRVERDGDTFTAYAGIDGRDYRKALTVFSPNAGKASSQHIVLGGQSFGNPGSCAVYRSITLDGKPLF